MKKRFMVLLFLVVLGQTFVAFAGAGAGVSVDKDAERYLSVIKPADILRTSLTAAFGAGPDVDYIMKEIDMAKIHASMKRALIKVYSPKEIKMLADFVSQPGGKDILNKTGMIMQIMAPDLQAEMTRVVEKKMRQVDEKKEK